MANRGVRTETLRMPRTSTRFESKQWMLTTASTIRCRIGWHSSVQGYFTTEGAEMKKARVVGHPGGNSRVKRLELSEPSEAKAPA